ncbi:MAG: hypothetical protein ACYC1L_18175 [Alphaproteobacteria bacterium]
MIGVLRPVVNSVLTLSVPLVLAGCMRVTAATLAGGDPFQAAAYSAGLGPMDFDATSVSFSPDSRTLVTTYSYRARTKRSAEWAVLDLASLSMKDVSLEVCDKEPAAPDYLGNVRQSPDGKFVLGNGTKESPAGPGLFMRDATGGLLTKIADRNPNYFFTQGRELIYLARHVYPLGAAAEAAPNGTYGRAYDLRRRTYVDPRSFAPVASATSNQIILPQKEYVGLTPLAPIGLASDDRHLLFQGQAATDSDRALAQLKGALAAKGEKIAYRSQLLFQLDLDTEEFSVHPLTELVFSDPDLRTRKKSPEVALVRLTKEGDIFFTVRGVPAVLQFRDDAITRFVTLPPSIDTEWARSFAVSPDRKWMAFIQRSPHTAGSGWNYDAFVLDAAGKIVFEVNRNTAKPAACGTVTGWNHHSTALLN